MTVVVSPLSGSEKLLLREVFTFVQDSRSLSGYIRTYGFVSIRSVSKLESFIMENGLLERVEGNANVHIWSRANSDNQHKLKKIWGQWGIKAKQLFYNNHGDSQYLLDLGIDENLFRAITQYWNLVYSCFTFGKADMVSVVEEYSVLWCCPMIQVYSKADRIPTFMRKLMNIMGIGSELKWKEQEGKWAVLEFLPLPPLVRLNVVSNQSRIGYEEECSTLCGKAKTVDGESVGRKVIDRMHGPTKESESSQETLKNNFTDIGRGVHRCKDYPMDEAIAQIRDGSRLFMDHKVVVGNIALEEGKIAKLELAEETKQDLVETYGNSKMWSKGVCRRICNCQDKHEPDVPSIAAMVSSKRWPLISSYGTSGLSDKVDDGIMKEALLDFYTSSGKRKPDQIIIFRDGVSEFQFNQVLIKLLRLASSLARSGTLKIVVIIVQKTIIPGFFQQGSPDNVLHSTVTDNKVCHPKNNDYYLGTYAGMIGITRQTHYHVLLDQAGFLADDLQKFVYSLSYMYQRSTTAIVVVAPICYAHLAALQLGAIYED
ncbi:hypothetical protein CXB51_025194 [Gossypium anomalum]|uniref:Piwi domain-containing protein n=1 Tax=Gossypium anomalum TaxID=47600 RepID=A0A8J6CQY0_9ROSI|nr:hypothetical protein CXB51_025194 [Gossypium anomalum]